MSSGKQYTIVFFRRFGKYFVLTAMKLSRAGCPPRARCVYCSAPGIASTEGSHGCLVTGPGGLIHLGNFEGMVQSVAHPVPVAVESRWLHCSRNG